MLWHIFKNGWEDKQFIAQRVYGMDEIRKEVEKWTPEEVERVERRPQVLNSSASPNCSRPSGHHA